MIHELSRLAARHGLPGTETAALIETLPERQRDAAARLILQQGAHAMEEFLANHDRNVALQMHDRLSTGRRKSFGAHWGAPIY